MSHRFTCSWSASERMGSALLLLLICFLLSACGGSQHTSASGSTAGAAKLPSPTATSNPSAFRAVFYEQDTPTACPPGKTASCLLFEGNGQSVGYGTVTMTRLEIVSTTLDSRSCQKVVGTGSLSTNRQDRIAFAATGTSCVRADTASLTYHISGGAGEYRGASGSGTIMVHATDLYQGSIAHRSEIWNGILTYPGQS
jgi:hypothetical protein